uniref:HTH La-type RNA-binding domain-containing protein n=1 Tax=Lactuca sativa TaxID=4236 RepID=A0A9R1W2K6_LACSA|nr:hypothetical protein LSAT_V11C400212970 [Lactuca sativa]
MYRYFSGSWKGKGVIVQLLTFYDLFLRYSDMIHFENKFVINSLAKIASCDINDGIRNIRMVTRCEDKEYVLDKELKEIDESSATPEEIAEFRTHEKDATKVLRVLRERVRIDGVTDTLHYIHELRVPPPMFFAVPDPSLHARIVTQIDYYFSNENLVKDTYLRQNMDEQGWVPVSLIAGFKKV